MVNTWEILKATAKVCVLFRDHQQPDGDRVQIRFNDQIFTPIFSWWNYKKLDVELLNGFNKIDFNALNQGSAGPNTAEYGLWWSRAFDDGQSVEFSYGDKSHLYCR